MSGNLIHVSDEAFDQAVLQSKIPVLVDFWAEWCGPCKMIAPILDEVAAEYQDKLLIAKMNVDQNTKIPAEYGVRGIPSLLIFKEGVLAGTKVGALSKSQLKVFIDSTI